MTSLRETKIHARKKDYINILLLKDDVIKETKINTQKGLCARVNILLLTDDVIKDLNVGTP